MHRGRDISPLAAPQASTRGVPMLPSRQTHTSTNSRTQPHQGQLCGYPKATAPVEKKSAVAGIAGPCKVALRVTSFDPGHTSTTRSVPCAAGNKLKIGRENNPDKT